MTTTNPRTGKLYNYHSGNNHEVICGKCGEILKEGEKIIFRPSPCRRHLGYLLHGRHVVHAYHEVDAHGESLYE